jgi:hypothetical protein
MKRRRIKMKKKLILGAILAICLAVIIAVSAVAPALANKPSDPSASNVEYVYGTGGYVVLNLPQGALAKPLVFKISFQDVEKRSTKGAENALEVALWIPALNKFSASAFIDDNPTAVASLTKMFAGIPLLIIQINKGDLQIWREDDTTIVNLTKPVPINYPAGPTQALSYTLPPMTLQFVKTGEVYEKLVSTSTLPSGWKTTSTKWNEPAWASVSIPSWIGATEGIEIPTAAVLNAKYNIFNVIPP